MDEGAATTTRRLRVVGALAHRIAPRPVTEITALYAGYEDLKVRKNQFDFEDLLLHATALLETEPRYRSRSATSTATSWSTSIKTSTRLSNGCSTRGSATATISASSATPSRRSTRSPAPSPEYLTGFATRYPKATVVRLVRDYRSTPQVVALANRLSGGALVAHLPAGPIPVVDSYADEVAEAAAVADQDFAPDRRRHARERDRGAVPHQRAVRGVRAGARRSGRALRAAGRRAVLRAPRGSRSRVPAARRGARRAARRRHARRRRAQVLVSVGFGPVPPSGLGVARDRWESLAALVRLAEERQLMRRADRRRRADGDESAGSGLPVHLRSSSPSSKSARRCSTRRSSTASRWHRCMPPRAWSGTPCSWSAWSTARCRSSTPRRPRRSTRNAGCSTSASPGPAAFSHSRGRRLDLPVAGPRRRPSRFLDDVRAATAVGRRLSPAPTRSPSALKSGRDRVERCRVCQKLLTSGAARKLGRCTDCPGSVDEELFERLRAWRLERSKELKQPAFCVFTDATLTRIAEVRPQHHAGTRDHRRRRAAKLTAYAEEVLELCGSIERARFVEFRQGDSASLSPQINAQ